jgi:hypothetical protein
MRCSRRVTGAESVGWKPRVLIERMLNEHLLRRVRTRQSARLPDS